jgi:hypothetical protein
MWIAMDSKTLWRYGSSHIQRERWKGKMKKVTCLRALLAALRCDFDDSGNPTAQSSD